MNIKDYTQEVSRYLDSLSDEEFTALLLEAGIEKCPYISGPNIEIKVTVPRSSSYVIGPYYSFSNFHEEAHVFFNDKVA